MNGRRTDSRTWTQYREIAAFFSGRRLPDGTTLAGTLEAYARDGQRIWYLFSHAAAYANHPDHSGAMFFDPNTMVPAIDNPGWVRALREFLELRRYGPADASSLDSETVRRRFAAGQAAMDIDWADTGVLAGAAWSYLAWYASPEHSAQDMLDGSSGINPYRTSHLDDLRPWQALLGERQAEDYLGVLRASLAAPQVARDLRLPGYRAYIAALEDQLDRVMAGSATPEEGLGAAARVWEALTDRLGRNSQRRHYRESMGLE